MRKLLFTGLLLLTAVFTQAQTIIKPTGPATAKPGSQVTITLEASGGSPAGLQWTIGVPASWTATAVAGSAATGASKTLYCNSTSLFCLVVGLNQNLIENGPVAIYTVTIPPTATPGSYPFPLSNLMGATVTGTAIPTTGTAYALTLLSRTDLNGDGKTDVSDLQILITQIVGTSACTDDQNGDGKCDLLDALIIVRAALGI